MPLVKYPKFWNLKVLNTSDLKPKLHQEKCDYLLKMAELQVLWLSHQVAATCLLLECSVIPRSEQPPCSVKENKQWKQNTRYILTMIRGIAGLGKWLYEHNLAVKNMQNELASEAKLRTTRSPCPNPWLPYTPTLWETAGEQYCLASNSLSLNCINFSHI